MFAYLSGEKKNFLQIMNSPSDEFFSLSTDISGDCGRPVVNGEQLFVYSLDEAYLGGNRKSFEATPPTAIKVNLDNYPKIKKLYIDLASENSF